MSGFFDEGLAGVVATWIAALVTIGVWAYLVGERRFFRLAQHLLAGLATGYLDRAGRARGAAFRGCSNRWSRRSGRPAPAVAGAGARAGHGRCAMAATSGGGCPGSQSWSPARPRSRWGAPSPARCCRRWPGRCSRRSLPRSVLNGLIGLVITALVLLGFLHGVPRGRLLAGAAGTGRWLLLGGIGGWLGFLLVSRLALLVDRLQFLLGDWLGIAR